MRQSAYLLPAWFCVRLSLRGGGGRGEGGWRGGRKWGRGVGGEREMGEGGWRGEGEKERGRRRKEGGVGGLKKRYLKGGGVLGRSLRTKGLKIDDPREGCLGRLFGRVVWEGCLGGLFGRVVWEGCLRRLFGGVVWEGCLGGLFGRVVWEGCLGGLFGRVVWEGCLGGLFGRVVWEGCLGGLFGRVVWEGCMEVGEKERRLFENKVNEKHISKEAV